MSTGVIYEHDLEAIAQIVAALTKPIASCAAQPNHYVNRAEIEVWNGDGYEVGRLIYEDEQLRFEVADQTEATS